MAFVQSNKFSLVLFFILATTSACITVQAVVPKDETFSHVLDGDFGDFVTEYDASYQMLPIFGNPFQLAFYNTTPNAFTLALRMGLRRSESTFFWVWEANRGNPVGLNATLTFGPDGNLVLADADGRVAWQTNTANKGVAGLKLLSNGNLVLYDSKANFVWQSFDNPTDTLLVGQSLKINGSNKLVSRLTEKVNKDGPYSLVLEPKGLSLYYKSNTSPKPVRYFNWPVIEEGSLDRVTLTSVTPADEDEESLDVLRLNYEAVDSNQGSAGFINLGSPVNNSTLTYLRLGIDGNVYTFTYFVNVRRGVWRETYKLFDRNSDDQSECQLPSRCGEFGICEDNQCVACPVSNGLLAGWSKDCKVKPLTSCSAKDFHYYKLEGVDHYMVKYSKGAKASEIDCERKCSGDCKCLGYFYHKENSRCWLGYDLGTLSKVGNASHLGYIKTPNERGSSMGSLVL